MKYPKASIVIATLNNAKVLKKVLNGMLSLDYPNDYEIIVVNDGSTDNTKEMLQKEFGKNKRIKIINLPRSGVCKARNAGIKQASFPIVVNMDHDCIPEKVWLRKIVEPFEDKKVGVTTSFGGYGGTSTAFRKELLDKAGGYDEDYFYYREDTDLTFKIMELGYQFVDVGKKESRGYYFHDHKAVKPEGLIGYLKHGWQRTSYHKNDVLLYRKHPNKLAEDFLHIKFGFLVDPFWDFAIATGLWRKDRKIALWSPRDITYIENKSPLHLIIIISLGIGYAIAVKLVRLYGSIKFGKLLI